MTSAGPTAASPELPERFADIEALEECMSRPTPELVADLAAVPGDILVLGAGGKMGPTLCRMAKRAAPAKRIVAVARFTEAGLEERLRGWGIETIACDLLEEEAVGRLPRLDNVIYMAGRKFGSLGAEALTWAMNVLVPGRVASVFRESRIVAFSTACVYPYMPVTAGGAVEETPTEPPVGDYAWSCVGRERAFLYGSERWGTPGRLIRLCYAIDMRYGVLHDIASKVQAGEPVDLAMGHVNVIWQGDANAMALRSLRHVTSPTSALNVTGPETISVRRLAERFAGHFGREAIFLGEETGSAWLCDAARAFDLFGYPRVPLSRLVRWQADWLARGMPSLGKPTHFEVRDGRY